MDYFWYLFRFDGRINRARYWYACFANLVFCLVPLAMLAYALVFGLGVKSVHVNVFNILGLPPSWPIHASFTGTGGGSSAMLSLLLQVGGTPILVAGIWFLMAAMIRRLHDRNKSGWWIVPFFILPALLNRAGFQFDVIQLSMTHQADTNLDMSFGPVGLALSVWGFIALACLKGTRGPNRFGPDPLAPAETTPGLDRQGELQRA